ncbi:MAG TPA: antitoxin Xre/MbcA/ParS toxin-binding domain-containing protein [Rhizomicrobium sp.]|nr:antitoxin Xre/MbcA/ParS toxin-binding domain-containing protein [Rhizomicrobium sp.]
MGEFAEVARVLGLKNEPVSGVGYLELVDKGFPIKSLDLISTFLAPGDVTFKYRIVSKASLARRKPQHRLSAGHSVVISRLASVWATALRIWKSEEAARDFLYRRHPLLDQRRPIDLVLENEIGAELVKSVLGRLEYGSAV